MINLLAAIDPVAFSIGNIDIAWYGIIVTTGIIAGFILFLQMAKLQKMDEDFALEAFLWIVICAIVFARIFYVVPRIGKSYHTFQEMINIREGGLTIVGGIFGGVLGAFLCVLRNKKYHLVTLLDAIPLPLLLGQAIGRWGNFVNQELFGLPITNPTFQHFPFAVYIDQAFGYEEGWYCALFFYEGVLNSIALIVGFIMLVKYKDKIKPLTFTLSYFIWYGVIRTSLDFLKNEHATLGNTQIGLIQIICTGMALLGIVLLVLLYKGKIQTKTKWFATKIEQKQQKLLQKQATTSIEEESTAKINIDENGVENPEENKQEEGIK